MRWWFQWTIGVIIAAVFVASNAPGALSSATLRRLTDDLPGVTQAVRPTQYVQHKLQLAKAHRLAQGNKVSIALIDSEIDVSHPILSGAAIQQYDPIRAEHEPHPHGTGVAGAIAAQYKLTGVAPRAQLMGVRVFSRHGATGEASIFNILKGLDWAIRNNVRIVNMSFTGPRDPRLDHALQLAHDKGVILIAAVGNGGPQSAPLFPAANPHVIGVTATDAHDRLFADASRGDHVAIAAPGVDILVPAPNAGYQLTTGTSIAAAHVTGVVALMLERNPNLTPAEVRNILAASARPLGPSHAFGAGLVDPVRAIEMASYKVMASVR
jgi:subtilisin family serine protease